MFQVLQVVSAFLVSVTMALALAHALELPGKMRLDKQAYFTVQPIYYPGFTIGGLAEPLGMVTTLLLLVLTPRGSAAFWWTLSAWLALLATHAVYWLLTHPVNKFWLRDQNLKGVSAGFFAFDPMKRSARAVGSQPDAWERFRNQWEYSHVLRAIFSALALLALLMAVIK